MNNIYFTVSKAQAKSNMDDFLDSAFKYGVEFRMQPLETDYVKVELTGTYLSKLSVLSSILQRVD